MPSIRPFFDVDYPKTGHRGALAPVAPDWVDARVLAVGTAEVFAVPAGAKYVLFSSTDHFFARFGASGVAVVVPSIDITDGSAGELNPAARRIPDGATHIAVISPSQCIITMAFYGEMFSFGEAFFNV